MWLVGVDHIVDTAVWLSRHSSPVMRKGQTFQMVTLARLLF